MSDLATRTGTGPAAARPAAARPPAPVTVVGRGVLAEAVAAALVAAGATVRQSDGATPDGATPAPAAAEAEHRGTVVRIYSAGDDGSRAQQQAAALGAGPAWLPVTVEWDRIVVGPLVRAGIAGCDTCATLRRGAAQPGPAGSQGAAAAVRLSSLGADQVAAVVAEALLPAGRPVDTDRAGAAELTTVRLRDLAVRRHRFLPEPLCPHCGELPADTADAAVLPVRPVSAHRPGSYRTRSLDGSEEEIARRYVDDTAGLVSGMLRMREQPVPLVAAPMGPRAGAHAENGYGRTLDYRSARTTAVLEALERYAGFRPSSRRTVVRGSHRELAATAVHPPSFGLHPDPVAGGPERPYRRYHDDLELDWVWGYSFARAAPVLVPESYAYYGVHHGDPARRPFVHEVSNGCALGGSLEEAILHGLFELAERDAFLMTWYARMAVPRVDLAGARDRTLPLLAERIEHQLGYRVRAFDTTLEHGLPSVWVMAVDATPSPERARVMCAAGAHPDPERALAAALLELAPGVAWQSAGFAQDRERAAAMVADPSLVRAMPDHALQATHPDAWSRFAFLDGDQEARPIAEAFGGAARRTPGSDLRAELDHWAGRYLGTGLDVIAVDQTTPEQRLGGFHCAKVIVPGLLPMTFGHANRRVHGLPRVRSVPALLGYASQPLADTDLNPHPHPFP
ncbi:TOMM precursor leader peptide-binding protein [Kitasatospora sp. NPDC049258]|uniref:TOMM precursor leader peptide-binding protein n=1 Tax=Kitasatospora sp. NPDC049258 TaxID=3155394 RepID=UPI0034167C5B